MSNNIESFKQGAEVVGKAAAEKFDHLATKISEIKSAQESIASVQGEINDAIKEHVDRHDDDIRALKDNRHYIKASRHSLDDMDMEEQQLVFAWLDKMLQQMAERGFTISQNQRTFLLNFRKYIGMLDESFQIDCLSVLEKMGEGSTHRVIYKIYLALIYLHNNSLDPLSQLSDIDNMFKLSAQTKADEVELLISRAQTLGTEGLIAMYDQERPISSFTVANVFSQHINMGSHPSLSWGLQKNQLEDYVRSFALLAIDAPENQTEQLFSFSNKQKDFLVALSKQLGSRTVLFELNDLCKNPRIVNIDSLKNILDENNKKYTWLLDIVSLANFRESFVNNDALFLSITKFIQLEDPNIVNFIESVKVLSTGSDQSIIAKHIVDSIARKTAGWQHILSFRGMNLKGAFYPVIERLNEFSNLIENLNDELMDVDSECVDLLSESEFKQVAKRGGLFKKLNNSKIKVVDLFYQEESRLCLEAIKIASSFIVNNNYVFRLASLTAYMEDLRKMQFSSSSGEDWDSGFDQGLTKTDKGLERLRDLVDDLIEQLVLFDEGIFHESVEEKRRKLAEAKKMAEDEERAAKSTVLQEIEGRQVRVSVSWENWDGDLPFDPSDLKRAVSDGHKWLAATFNEVYVCTDGAQWVLVLRLDSSILSLKYVNNIWIVESDKNVHFSADSQKWDDLILPESSFYELKPSILFDGTYWVLRLNDEDTYTYEEKGFIWSSTESASYGRPFFYRAKGLGEKWEKWNEASDLPSGFVSCSNMAVFNNVFVNVFEYDWLYKSRKNIELFSGSSPMYIKGMKGWKDAEILNNDRLCSSNTMVFSWKNHFFIVSDYELFVSEKGFVWEKIQDNGSGGWGEVCGMLMLFPARGKQLKLSGDAQHFTELVLDEGEWTIFAAMGKSLLAIWQKDHHEVFLKKGKVHYNDV